MKLLDEYMSLQQRLFDYFGYVEDWRIFPVEDRTGKPWMLVDGDSAGAVAWSDVPWTKEAIEAGTQIYGGTIYTQRHLPKWVYRGKDHTMVVVDTHTDGNIVLVIFDNDLECTDEDLKEMHRERW